MKICKILVVCFFSLFVTFTSSSEVWAEWTPDSNIITEDHFDERSNSLLLSLPQPLIFEEAGITILEIDVFGGWDVGYRYHLYYNVGEGIDVAGDGWSNPQLMTKADFDVGARTWLKFTTPGISIDAWLLDPINIDLIDALKYTMIALGLPPIDANLNIDEELIIPDMSFNLPFISDEEELPELSFTSGIYADNYNSVNYIDLASAIPLAVANVGIARGIKGEIEFGLDSIDYYYVLDKIGSQTYTDSGVPMSHLAGQPVNLDSRDYTFRIRPSIEAGFALFVQFGITGFTISEYVPEKGATDPALLSVGISTEITDEFSLPFSTSYEVPAENQNISNIFKSIVSQSGSNGSISPSGSLSVTQGSDKTYTATPSNGYEVDKWYINGAQLADGDDSYTIQNIQSNITILVTFKPTNSIDNSQITVTSPNMETVFERGSNINIMWSSIGSVGESIKIELMKGGIVERTIRDSTSNDGSDSWKIPYDTPVGEDGEYYKIKITSLNNQGITDSSDVSFKIVEELLIPEKIEISTIQQLQLIGSGGMYPHDGHYILVGDIDASDFAFQPIGDGPLNYFNGILDGKGFRIKGLNIIDELNFLLLRLRELLKI
ncbi:Ser-Thr-rich GPI-anchored membrane family protein [Thermodesulfobacteriota bacterium]